ncbi:outer membrane protein assembly factor BamD [Propylenella binzhouense]|uniref:outer membrane protein assembly factor BamD n=1 Tax=Propylenella binzhouense TaxID=2555902 RepID=UPI0031B5A30C
MIEPFRRIFAAFGIAASAFVVSACSSTEDFSKDLVEPERADITYNKGLALLNAGDTTEAREKFEAIDKEHPYSDYARRALIMSAYLNFKRGRYPEAVNDGKRYVTLFPASKDAAYAQYIVGESYFRQIPDITRDQELSERAIQAMNEVVQKYPDSEYAEDARQKVQVAVDQLAGKEMQIGRYYEERRDYLAAVNRFKIVVTTYQTTRHVEEALHRLTECYLALGIVPEAQTAAAVLGHNFPDSEWYKYSYQLLQKGGVEPNENQGSWISRAFRGAIGA